MVAIFGMNPVSFFLEHSLDLDGSESKRNYSGSAGTSHVNVIGCISLVIISAVVSYLMVKCIFVCSFQSSQPIFTPRGALWLLGRL